ncbi:MAG: sensor histidine kinase [Clostridia bacterium]|nr:sensor histidine kinase [Clostridia bacterium]
MKELSLNILDITENSTKAGADNVTITINETEETMTISVSDDGCGMTEDFLREVTNPFTTTRTTRKVGLGIPLLKLAAEQTGGYVNISSKHVSDYPTDHGTQTTALFYKNHLDFTPLGDVVSTVTTLIQGHPTVDFIFEHTSPQRTVRLDTKELREILGDVPLDSFEVICWIKDFLTEQYSV